MPDKPYPGYYFLKWSLRKYRLACLQLKGKYFQDFVFIHINKTGGSSITKALNIYFEHKTVPEKITELGKACWEKRFTFTIVRNPWDRAVSHYHFRVKSDQTGLGTELISFPEWARLTFLEKNTRYYDQPKMFMPQWDWITDQGNQLLVDFVGRFERLEVDFQTICKQIGCEGTTLPHVKKSSRGPYRQYYDEESRKIVATYFQSDIDQFGYQF